MTGQLTSWGQVGRAHKNKLTIDKHLPLYVVRQRLPQKKDG